MSLKIALLGAAPSSDKLAPYNDMSWEIWACSPSNHNAPRVDAWFEIHNLERKWVQGNQPYIAALATHPRVYIAKLDNRLPHGIVYPKDEVYKFYGTENGPLPFMDTYMQSQVSFMLALAIMLKPDKIGLFGIDMAATDEWAHQRPGCHHFFNEAYKRKIDIVAPPQSDILNPLPLYAYKEFNPMYWRQKARKMEIRERLTAAQNIINEKQQEVHVMSGALQDIEYTSNTYLQALPDLTHIPAGDE